MLQSYSRINFVFFYLKMEHQEENPTKYTASKVICLSCKDTVINFHDFYRVVQTNQSLFLEYSKKIQHSRLTAEEEEQPPRFIFTIRTTTDGVALLNDYGALEYSLGADDKSNQSESNEKPTLQNYDVINENSVNITSDDSRLVDAYNESNFPDSARVEPADKIYPNTDSDSNVILFSRKNIDEKLPDHLKVRTSKEKSDAQIKEFVNLMCDICKTSPQFNSFKELQEHFSSEHNQRGYVECCDKKFYRKDRLMNHITNHIYPDAFK